MLPFGSTLPVPYATLVAQLDASLELLARLRAEPATPKFDAAIGCVEEARLKMFDALAACDGDETDRRS